MYRNILKPVFDFLLASALILFFSPLFILLIVLLYFFNQKNVFFFQARPGKNEKVFKIIKFKTMTDQRDSSGNLLPDELRLTRMGKFVRKTSLDELPQLINVFKGDMSFIGPRPLLVSYLSLYTKEQKRRHFIKPGITGWAQVNGRNTISWEKKFEYDVWYVDHLTFLLDLKIFLLTVKKVIIREGINTDGQATTESFKGSGNKISVIGAGGHSKVVIEIAEMLGYEISGVYDQNKNVDEILEYPVSHNFENIPESEKVFFALGNNLSRKKNAEHFPSVDFNLIHPSSILSKNLYFGKGNVVMAGAVINSSAKIGNFCIINTSASIDHDCEIEDYVHISPQAALAGNVKVLEGAQIGIGASVKQNITIGKWSVVGAGSVVVKDVPDNVTVVGNPARIIKNII